MEAKKQPNKFMAWDDVSDLWWMKPDRNWGASVSAAANIFMNNRRLAQDQQQFMMQLPAKMAESNAQVANTLLDSQATIAKLNDGVALKSAMLAFANAKTQEEKANISPMFTTPAAQSAWTKFRTDNFTARNVNEGFSKLGQLGIVASEMPDGWANPTIQREFNAIVAKHPEVTTSPRFALFENNIDAATKARQADARIEQGESRLKTWATNVVNTLKLGTERLELQKQREERLGSQAGPREKKIESLNSKLANLKAQYQNLTMTRKVKETDPEARKLEQQISGIEAELGLLPPIETPPAATIDPNDPLGIFAK